MSSRPIQWLQALCALATEGIEPANACTLCVDIERMERSRTLRASPGFRLLRLACSGKPSSPEAWVLRYAMGRALATQTDPGRKPGFPLGATCTLLATRAGSAIALLAKSGTGSLAGGLLVTDEDRQLCLADGLASWLLNGKLLVPGLEPIRSRDWLLQQQPLRATADRMGALVEVSKPSLAVLTSAEPLLAATLAAAIGQARGRPTRSWALRDARRGAAQPLEALRWIGAVEGFDPVVVLLTDEDHGPWSDDALRSPADHPPASCDACLWIATPEPEPQLPWLRDHPTRIDLAPLGTSIVLPGRAPQGEREPPPLRRRRRRHHLHFGYGGHDASSEHTELAAADQRLRLDPLQRAVFPDHDPAVRTSASDTTDDEAEPHLASVLWRCSEQTLGHLVLPEAQHQALVHAATRAKVGERCVVLLHGPPGSGKSLAARCLAGSADLPFYTLEGHLNRDQFFGEQDRKLAEVFAALAERPAVLVIDEADCWIGRREGSAARVGGAKISESSSLLLHLERYQGTAVLTTNRIEALDPALQRRVDLDLHLGLPGPEERMALWCTALGEELALQGDELCLLAAVPITGGDIVATVREVKLKQGALGVVALLAAARERGRRASLWG